MTNAERVEEKFPSPDDIMIQTWFGRVNEKVLRGCRKIGDEEGDIDTTGELLTRSFDPESGVYRWTVATADVNYGQAVRTDVHIDLIPSRTDEGIQAQVVGTRQVTLFDPTSGNDMGEPVEGEVFSSRYLHINQTKKAAKRELGGVAREIKNAFLQGKHHLAPEFARLGKPPRP